MNLQIFEPVQTQITICPVTVTRNNAFPLVNPFDNIPKAACNPIPISFIASQKEANIPNKNSQLLKHMMSQLGLRSSQRRLSSSSQNSRASDKHETQSKSPQSGKKPKNKVSSRSDDPHPLPKSSSHAYVLSSICQPQGDKYFQLYYYSPYAVKQLQKSTKQISYDSACQWASNWLIEQNAEYRALIKVEQRKIENSSRIATQFRTVKIGNYKVSLDMDLQMAYSRFYNCKARECRKRRLQEYKALGSDIAKFDMKWQHLNPQYFQDFIDWMYSNKSASTACNKLNDFGYFLNHCENESKCLPPLLVYALKAMIPKTYPHKGMNGTAIPKSLLKELMPRIKEEHPRMYQFIVLLTALTCRPNEIFKLKKQNLYTRFDLLLAPMNKTSRIKTQEDLPSQILNMLDSLAKAAPTEYLFTPEDDKNFHRIWNNYMQEYGFRKKGQNGHMKNAFDLRHFRHTAITNIIRTTKDVDLARRAAGHRHESTTLGYGYDAGLDTEVAVQANLNFINNLSDPPPSKQIDHLAGLTFNYQKDIIPNQQALATPVKLPVMPFKTTG